jgi:hypothetical protein
MYKVQIAKRLIDEEVRNNPEYAVPDWSKFEDDVVRHSARTLFNTS